MKNNKKEKNDKVSYIFTRETMGMTVLLFSAIVLLILFTNGSVFYGIGSAICTFMYGTFGYGSIILVLALAYLGEWLVFGKSFKIKPLQVASVTLTALMLFFLFHSVTTSGYELESYGKYINDCYVNAENGFAGYTFGGVISAAVVYPIAQSMSFIGAYVIFSLLTLACCYLDYIAFRPKNKKVKASNDVNNNSVINTQEEVENNKFAEAVKAEAVVTATEQPSSVSYAENKQPQQSEEDKYSKQALGRKILFEKGEFAAESYRRNMIFNENSYFSRPIEPQSRDNNYINSFSTVKKRNVPPQNTSYSAEYGEEIINQPVHAAPSNYVYGEQPVESLALNEYDDAYFERECTETDSKPKISYSQGAPYQPKQENVGTQVKSENLSSYAEKVVVEDKPTNVESRRVEVNENTQPYSETHTQTNESVNVGRRNLDSLPEQRNSVDERSSYALDEDFAEKTADKPANESSQEIYKLFDSSVNDNQYEDDDEVEDEIKPIRSLRSNAEIFDYDDEDGEEDSDTDESIFGRGSRGGIRSESTGIRGFSDDELEISESVEESPRAVRGDRLFGATQSVKPIESEIVNSGDKVVEPKPEKPKHVWKKYVRPTLDLLDDIPENSNVNTAEIEDSKRIIVETLQRFKIACEVSNVTIGPAITRYDIIIEDKTLIKKALSYHDAIAMELRKKNINAYKNYSKGAISLDVPNSDRSVVGLKGMLTSSKFINCKPNSLTFALGKNIEGEVVCPDITKMPHLLVAGTTGSGKSICLSSLLISLLYKYGPEDLRLILVDPKQVEFISYDKLPHLMINEIIYDIDKAIKALNWAIKEMERRYSLFKDMTEAGQATKNLDEYNAHLPEGEEKLPKILIVLDEFGDLMLQAKKDIESRIIKLVQKARACGIHLILATQRPSVDCITGLIKSNLPTRIGFKVNSFDDARTIFDIGGAEKLLGRGDMYFRSTDNPDLARIQGCFVDTHEVQNVTDFVKMHNETYFDQEVSDFINTVEQEETSVQGGDSTDDAPEAKIDETFIKALSYCITANQASVSMIQRRFPIGYIKACKIIDWMTNMNYITQSEGAKPRKVLLTREEFLNIYGDIDD